MFIDLLEFLGPRVCTVQRATAELVAVCVVDRWKVASRHYTHYKVNIKSHFWMNCNEDNHVGYCTVEANYWHTQSITHLCDSRATCIRVCTADSVVALRKTRSQSNLAYELETWYTDGGRWSTSAVGAVTSTVKGQGHTRFINTDRHLRHSECQSLRTSNWGRCFMADQLW